MKKKAIISFELDDTEIDFRIKALLDKQKAVKYESAISSSSKSNENSLYRKGIKEKCRLIAHRDEEHLLDSDVLLKSILSDVEDFESTPNLSESISKVKFQNVTVGKIRPRTSRPRSAASITGSTSSFPKDFCSPHNVRFLALDILKYIFIYC
jgi:hypothetical protein